MKKITKWILVSGLLIIIGFNFSGLLKKIKIINMVNRKMPHQVIALEFMGLEQFTKDFKYMGYYTDINIKKNEEAAKTFAQAQYWLAPTVLDFDNLNHEFILFVCSNEETALKKVAEINAIALKRNNFGMILARRKI